MNAMTLWVEEGDRHSRRLCFRNTEETSTILTVPKYTPAGETLHTHEKAPEKNKKNYSVQNTPLNTYTPNTQKQTSHFWCHKKTSFYIWIEAPRHYCGKKKKTAVLLPHELLLYQVTKLDVYICTELSRSMIAVSLLVFIYSSIHI